MIHVDGHIQITYKKCTIQITHLKHGREAYAICNIHVKHSYKTSGTLQT
jgi:hypothetical protein